MLNIAHRGASGTFPENTVSAFRAAIDAGADMCELDVQLSRDGAIVVIHDDTVERTTDGKGEVAELTLEELRRLDAGAKFKDGPFKGLTGPIERLDERGRIRLLLALFGGDTPIELTTADIEKL